MKKSLVILACLCFSVGATADVLVYNNNFEGSVGSEWSNTKTDMTPVGARRFLGQFHNDAVTLALGNLPAHTHAQVSFDLFIIRTWDGNLVADPNFPGHYIGPDIWDLSVVEGPTLLHTTFNNHDFYPGWTQAFPGAYPGGSYSPRTGAVENNTLGFTYGGYGVMDSVYHLSCTFSHSMPEITLQFSASTVDWVIPGYDPDTESWGMDNLQVLTDVVPEPSALITLMLGITSIAGTIRRRRKVAG